MRLPTTGCPCGGTDGSSGEVREDFAASNLSGCRPHDEDGLSHCSVNAVHSDRM